MDMRLLAKKGTLVICPNCRDEIAIVADDILQDKLIRADHFKWLNQRFVPGQEYICQKCGQIWFDGDAFFTRHGWIQGEECLK